MYLPRTQIAQLYLELLRTLHPLSPPVLILTSLTVDSLCATRILTALLKRDYVPHKVQPVSGYSALQRVGEELVLPLTRQRGGDGGIVVCLGVGGLVDIEEVLGLDGRSEQSGTDMSGHGVEVWVIDARRPWNLQNVFGTGEVSHANIDESQAVTKRAGVENGRVLQTYRSTAGGVIVWDDGDIDSELAAEKEAFLALQQIPDIDEDDVLAASQDDTQGLNNGDELPDSSRGTKRKAHSLNSEDEGDSESVGTDEDDDEGSRPRQRRRSNNSTPIPSSPSGNPVSAQIFHSTPPTSSQVPVEGDIPSSPPKQPSQRQLRKQLLREKRRHEATLDAYYRLGNSHAEPVSSMLYSLASELGREDNDLLWLAIVGISSVDLSPLSTSSQPSSESSSRHTIDKSEQIKAVLRDEVRRLNPMPSAELIRSQQDSDSTILTHARSPTDTSIRLSPEPKFLLIRHWSLYDSMYHSPFLSTRLHIWNEAGKKRLHKLLAKMGISLQEAGKGYVHMDLALKQSLRQRILKFASMYNLDGLVPGDDDRTGQQGWGFVRSWGWKATLSAVDVAMVVSAILEVGADTQNPSLRTTGDIRTSTQDTSYNARMRALPTPPHSEDGSQMDPSAASSHSKAPDWTTHRFFSAYDALNPTSTSSNQGLPVLLANIPTAQELHRAILRTGAALISKKQLRHLRAFRMGVVKDGPDVPLFTHPGALSKLAGWVSEATQVLEAEKGRTRRTAADDALVLGCLDEPRGVYVVVGLGGDGTGRARVRSKAEIKEREERRKRKAAEKAAAKAEKARKREESRQLRREILAANGDLDSDDESDATESDASSSSSRSDSDSDDSEDEEIAALRKQRGYGLNRFGQAFQEVVEETGARVRIDSFEHSVVEVRKEDLAGFLERLSLKSVIG